MTPIKKEDLVKLYTELDTLKEHKKKLQQGFIDLKMKSSKIEEQNNYGKWIIAILAIISIGTGVYLYMNHASTKKSISKLNSEKSVLLNQIKELQKKPIVPVKEVTKEALPSVTYSVQLGVFNKLKINLADSENMNFRSQKTTIGNAYQIGVFRSFKAAQKFKTQIRKLGMRGAILVSYDKNNKKISLKEAKKLSKE